MTNGLFNSPTLEVAVALFFLYFVLSLIASAVNEAIATTFNSRATTLRSGIDHLLRYSSIATAFQQHPLIRGLGRPRRRRRPLLPSVVAKQQVLLAPQLSSLRAIVQDSQPTTLAGRQTKERLQRELDALDQALMQVPDVAPQPSALDATIAKAHHERILAHIREVAGHAEALGQAIRGESGVAAAVAQDLATIAAGLKGAATELTITFAALHAGGGAYPSYISDVTFTQSLFDSLAATLTPGNGATAAIEQTTLTVRNLLQAIDRLARGSEPDKELAQVLRAVITANQDLGGLAGTRADVQRALLSLVGPDLDLVKAAVNGQQTAAVFLRSLSGLPVRLRLPFEDALKTAQQWTISVDPARAAYGNWYSSLQRAVQQEKDLVEALLTHLQSTPGSVPPDQPAEPLLQPLLDALAQDWSIFGLAELVKLLPAMGDPAVRTTLHKLVTDGNTTICTPRQQAFAALTSRLDAPLTAWTPAAALFAGGEAWREFQDTFEAQQYRVLLELATKAADPNDAAMLNRCYQGKLADSTVPAQDKEVLQATVEGAALQQLVNVLQSLPAGPARNSLLTRIQGDLDLARQAVQRWYNEAMDRLTGAYKQQTQVTLLLIGLGLALLIGADTLRVVNRLSTDQQVRDTVTQSLTSSNAKTLLSNGSSPITDTTALNGALSAYSGELGYNDRPCIPPSNATTATHAASTTSACLSGTDVLGQWDWWSWLLVKLIGMVITAFAISLGAPFWFDLLSKLIPLIGLGSSGPPPVTSGTSSHTASGGNSP